MLQTQDFFPNTYYGATGKRGLNISRTACFLAARNKSPRTCIPPRKILLYKTVIGDYCCYAISKCSCPKGKQKKKKHNLKMVADSDLKLTLYFQLLFL